MYFAEGMEEELAESDPCSNSSLLLHCSSGDESRKLQSPLSEHRNVHARTKKFLQHYNFPVNLPNLKEKPLETRSGEVDLALPSEKLDSELFTKFPQLKNHIKRAEGTECKVQKGIPAQQNVKKELRAKMAARRKVEQQRRKQLYIEDNEDRFGDNSTEDDDEMVLKKKEKTKLKAPKPTESDNSEDDEDYVADEGDEGDSESSSNENEDNDVVNESVHNVAEQGGDSLPLSSFKESIDIFGSQSPSQSSSLESHKNVFNPCSPPTTVNLPSQFPSFSQWYTSGSEKLKDSKESDDELFDEFNKTLTNEPVNTDDLLMFCSGQFDIPAPKESTVSIVHQPVVETTDENDDSIKPTQKKTRRLVESDDEDVAPQNNEHHADEHADEFNEVSDVKSRPRRTIIMSDNEDEEENPTQRQNIIEISQEVIEDLEEEISDEEKEQSDKESEADAEGNDSDDELAVIRRLESKEHKRKLRKGKFLDDEASLSGSDVGSDIDEDGESNDEYELDECDKEQFDEEDIRNKNHKLYLKQQQQENHRDIAKLQDRLLADGDLAGVETNRSFRTRLRDDPEVDMNELNDCSQDTLSDDDNYEEDRKKKSDVLKFKAEMHALEEPPLDDDIERAANTATLTEISVEFSQEYTRPTLIGKTPLMGVFKDNNGSIATRQMFTNTTECNMGKRIFEPHVGQPKRQKLTLLDHLEV